VSEEFAAALACDLSLADVSPFSSLRSILEASESLLDLGSGPSGDNRGRLYGLLRTRFPATAMLLENTPGSKIRQISFGWLKITNSTLARLHLWHGLVPSSEPTHFI